eukprot:scaffold1833_cov263-Chaetoceros_neogracile.AAC.20
MKADLLQLCFGKEWPEGRKYLSSDAAEEEKKSNVMCRDGSFGRTCLHLAFCRGAPDDIMKAMVDIGGNESVMMIDNDERTALHSACMNGAYYNIIKMLIEVGVKDLVMVKSRIGNTALHRLCVDIKKHTEVAEKIKLILQVGDANLLLSTKNLEGETLLKIATDNGASNIIKKLLTLQSTTNSTTNNDRPSANIVPADNSTPVTQSSQEQDTTQSSSTNSDLNIPIRGLDIDQNYQSQLREAEEKATTIQQDFDQKCIDYSDLEKNSQSQLKKAKEQTLDSDQKCAAHANELEESKKKIADLVATVEAQRITIVEGEGTVVQFQSQSSKRSKGKNAANISSVAFMCAAVFAGHTMLGNRHMATRRELCSAKARNVELEQEIDDLAI